MIIQNENKDIKHNNSDTKRLEHLRILLKHMKLNTYQINLKF